MKSQPIDLNSAIAAKSRESYFERIYAKHRKAFIFRAVGKHGCSMADAEDLFQDAVTTLYSNLYVTFATSVEEVTSIRSYLNKTSDYMQCKKAAKRKLEGRFAETDECVMNPKADDAGKDALELVYRALYRMSEKKRLPIILYYLKGYCHEAIAREMNFKNPSVAKAAKNRNLKLLAKICKPQGNIRHAQMPSC